MRRRTLLVLAGLAPFALPGRALAGFPLPRRDPPQTFRPLGIWALPVRKLEVVQDGRGAVDVDVPLQFKPAIDVAAPLERWWRLSAVLRVPKSEVTLSPAMVSGIWTDVPISIRVPAATRKGGYRITCEMVDPATRRRAVYSFLLTVLDKARG